ncbi:hypothetical protein EDI_007770 [Entamoeba dispar SAW760]|uniref:UDENN domain-containing protein n=1 Tax=Entamoeba dispar (strain ATCC PRA-260 / SAW760) TaxID=370354 RepID=B0ECF8_ENTDS|nr:uncharacterized protein EDI_007770 [Entamoeba dispar SAW760]EDR27801.1 hypothetical protein EDI_007770 [Entamoeba dispar SAW760]|eukprot:EDR27801.1 hypothetical protein EDI_007770 [Entamoeba dispar SAW760]
MKNTKLKIYSKRYKSTDFDEERKRRNMFSQLKLGELPPQQQLADQFLIIGSNSIDDTPTVLYQYPQTPLNDFTYDILVDYCFPEGVLHKRKEAKSVEEVENIIHKCKISHQHVSHFFTFFFASQIIGLTRYAFCFSKLRIQRDETNPLVYYEDEVIYVLLSLCNRFSLQITFLESLLDLDYSNQITFEQHPPCDVFEDYLHSYFLLSSNFSKEIKVSWKADPLINKDVTLSRCLFFRVIPLNNLLTLISAVLLERKVFIKSEHRCLVSNAISFLIEVIKPFTYEFPIISVLTNKLIDLMDSPTPLLVGCYKVPSELPENSYLYNIDSKTLQCFGEKVIPFPNNERIINDIKEILKPLKGYPAHSTSKCILIHSQIIEWAMQKIQVEIRLMFQEFEDYCISSRGSDCNAISLFMKNEFVQSQNKDIQPFLKEFVETQMFENFKTKQLVEIDKKKAEQLKKR